MLAPDAAAAVAVAVVVAAAIAVTVPMRAAAERTLISALMVQARHLLVDFKRKIVSYSAATLAVFPTPIYHPMVYISSGIH
jgi:hypothetical protein